MLVSWPVLDVICAEPTPSQKVAAIVGHLFLLNKLVQDDFYTIDALSNSTPSEVWMYFINSMDEAAFTNAFDSRYVSAHVHVNEKRADNGYFRMESSLSRDLPIIIEDVPNVNLFPVWFPHSLTRSQSSETLEILSRAQPTTTRKHWGSEFIYLREFISTDTSPTPVGYVVTRHEPPMTIDVFRERFPPEARVFAIRAALRSDFVDIRESALVTRFNEELRRMFDPPQAADTVTSRTTVPVDSLSSFLSISTIQTDTAPSLSASSFTNVDLDPGSICRKCGQSGHLWRDCPRLDDFRSVNPKMIWWIG